MLIGYKENIAKITNMLNKNFYKEIKKKKRAAAGNWTLAASVEVWCQTRLANAFRHTGKLKWSI